MSRETKDNSGSGITEMAGQITEKSVATAITEHIHIEERGTFDL